MKPVFENHMIKMVFKQVDIHGDLDIESMWVSKLQTGNYKVESIPFFITGLAYEDIVAAEVIAGELCGTEIIKRTGNSTIRIYLDSENDIKKARNELKKMGCSIELGFKKVLAVNIPKGVHYLKMKAYLEKGENKGFWEYDEGYLAEQKND